MQGFNNFALSSVLIHIVVINKSNGTVSFPPQGALWQDILCFRQRRGKYYEPEPGGPKFKSAPLRILGVRLDFCHLLVCVKGFSSGSGVKNPCAVQELQETQVQSLGLKDPLEKEMAAHSSILVWRIPWTEELGRLQPMGLQRAGHD